jgi:hypothetical protein
MEFNKWSRDKLAKGIKFTTARTSKHDKDPDVYHVFQKPIPMWIIKQYFYLDEGAESPDELQRVINQIFRRKVDETRELYLHVLRKKGDS